MTPIQWGQASDRIYEVGLDRGVLYLENGEGVPWNGLTSVDESSLYSTESYFFDGLKFIDFPSSNDSSVKVKAITYPEELDEHVGYFKSPTGIQFDNDRSKEFSISYRTLVGDGNDGLDVGYKLHILYNLTARPDAIARATIDSNIEPIEFGWAATTRPVQLDGFAPTSHVILDSRYLGLGVLDRIERYMYGEGTIDGEVPPLEWLAVQNYTYKITDNGDGTWTAEGPDELITMLDTNVFQLEETNAVYLPAAGGDVFYTISSS